MAYPGDTELDRENDGLMLGDILVVDDNSANLLAMEAVLGSLGSPVIRAQSGQEALHLLLERDFALILLDVQMPLLDGFETARMIRERRRSRHTPIIFVTAHGREEKDVLAAYQLGAVDFMFKPVVPEILRSKAGVFVELYRRSALLGRQSEQLRQHEHREHERALEEERRRWDEEALHRQMEEMAEADRRKDEFLAVLGHELRNPLSAIVTGCSLLEHKLGEIPGIDPSILHTRNRIDRQAQHLRRLVDDLLDLARINSGKIELKLATTSAQDVIEQAVVTTSAVIEERNHDLVVEVPPDPVILHADPVRLIQAVANLINNAARYTDEGGTIWIGCALNADGQTVRIQIRDNGRGIPPELLPRVFDIFVQESGNESGKEGGLGLGLTIVKRLIDLHGGRITASSPGPGLGSTFALDLKIDPVATAAAAGGEVPVAAQTAEVAADRENPVQPLSVVLIEDNEDIRESMSEFLSDLGHSVCSAEDGGRGLAMILETKPDVAIVDVGLPVLDGYQVATQVRERMGDAAPRLVAMTGYGQEADRRRARDAGFDRHLVKPAELKDIIAVLQPREMGAADTAAGRPRVPHGPQSGS
jgi:signal transduction histidine kinase